MLGNNKLDLGEVVSAVLAVIVTGLVAHYLYTSRHNLDNKCQWELDHNITSYECRDWEAE